MMSNSSMAWLTMSKARSHCVLWPAQFGRKLVLGTRRRPKWPRPRRWQFFSRRDRDVGTSRDRLKTETWPRPQPCGEEVNHLHDNDGCCFFASLFIPILLYTAIPT